MVSVAIPLWIVSVFVPLLILIPEDLSSFTAVAWLSLFVPAVIFTVKEENARHARGERGLGPAGITALVCSLGGPLVIGLVVAEIRKPGHGFDFDAS